MEHIEASKLIPIAVAVITVLGKLIYVFITRNGERMKIRSSSVDMIDKVINEREWSKRENRIVIEESFEQLYSAPLSYAEIRVLIYCESPNKAIRSYLRYRPAVEFNNKKNKFRFRKGRESYWKYGGNKIPKALPKGVLFYFLWALPASYGVTWLMNNNYGMVISGVLWLIDIFAWFIAVVFLIGGMKYHFCEDELKDALGNKLELNKTSKKDVLKHASS